MKTCEGAVSKGSFSLPCLALQSLSLTYHLHPCGHNHPNSNCRNSDYNSAPTKWGERASWGKRSIYLTLPGCFLTKCCGMTLFQWCLWCSKNMVGVVKDLASFRVICGRSNCLPQNQHRNKKDIAVFFMEKNRLNAQDEKYTWFEYKEKFRQYILAIFVLNLKHVVINNASPLLRIMMIIFLLKL